MPHERDSPGPSSPPPGFLAEVDAAERSGDRGKLELLAAEIAGRDWERRGLAAIERARHELRGGGPQTARVLLFTGHRIDAPGRARPRFPAAAEDRAYQMIHAAVASECDPDGGTAGLAGGASGGDILFHEACEALGIPTRLLLAGPRDAYVEASVADAGAEWIARFDRLWEARRASGRGRVLGEALELPGWLGSRPDYSVWERGNLWLLHSALAHGASRVVLLALWNGEGGDGPGGTQHLVETVRARGGRTVVLDSKRLLAGPDPD